MEEAIPAFTSAESVERHYQRVLAFRFRILEVAEEYAGLPGEHADLNPARDHPQIEWNLEKIMVEWDVTYGERYAYEEHYYLEFPTSYLWDATWKEKELATRAWLAQETKEAKELQEREDREKQERHDRELYERLKNRFEPKGALRPARPRG